MSRLLESIKVEGGRFLNLEYHQARVDRSVAALFPVKPEIDLKTQLEIPAGINSSIHKCRVEYDTRIKKIEFQPYFPKSITTLKLIEADDLDYQHKYADRSWLNKLYEKKAACDDVLFVKKGLITDTSYCNILFYDGKCWVTPESPLLKGTKRQQLLDEGRVKPQKITPLDLQRFESFMLINAMLDFDKVRRVPVLNIFT
jgi:4-amino-4-deoxychorismate lyase